MIKTLQYILKDQNKYLIDKAKIDPIHRDFRKRASLDMIEKLMAFSSNGAADESSFVSFLRDYSKYQMDNIVPDLKCSVLILQGDKDFQVSPLKDSFSFYSALKRRRNKDVSMKIFHNVDHLFKIEKNYSSPLS